MALVVNEYLSELFFLQNERMYVRTKFLKSIICTYNAYKHKQIPALIQHLEVSHIKSSPTVPTGYFSFTEGLAKE